MSLQPTNQAQRIEKFQGLVIYLSSVDEGGAYIAYNGCECVADAMTLEDAREQINEWFTDRE